MLSFDITDKSIKIIKGYESHGKIKINAAATLELNEDIIVNGHVTDIPRLATLLNDILKDNKMKEKEAKISISSNLTIFKELKIPKANNKEFFKMICAEMQSSLGIDDSYSIAYIIVGTEGEKNENGTVIEKVLATACPYEVIESYKKVFAMMSISLKSVMIGCNCISRLILSDVKLRLKMPLLAVQIDKNFLSINLYDESKLAFSRFTTIDKSDYYESDNYVTEAVNENIFRMVQFQKTRNPEAPIEHVAFYGDVSDVDSLLEAAKQMEIEASVITAPAQISGYENLDFLSYANAIGAMYKRNKSTEKINLLETDTTHRNKIKSDKSYLSILTGLLILTVVVIGGIWAGLDIKNKNLIKDTKELNSKISSPETRAKQNEYAEYTNKENKVNAYRTAIGNASDAFKTRPLLENTYYNNIEEAVKAASDELGLTSQIDKLDYNNYTFTLQVVCSADSDPSQTLPSKIIEKLETYEDFINIGYVGYNLETITDDHNNQNSRVIVNTITIILDDIEPETEVATDNGNEGSVAE